MSNYRQTSHKRTAPKRAAAKKQRISFTYRIAALVLVYLMAQLIIFFNRDTTNYVVAKQGEIVETFSTQGVIIRDEQLVKATSNGIVQYYYPGGKELKKNARVCTLLDDYYGDILEDKIVAEPKAKEKGSRRCQYVKDQNQQNSGQHRKIQFVPFRGNHFIHTPKDIHCPAGIFLHSA